MKKASYLVLIALGACAGDTFGGSESAARFSVGATSNKLYQNMGVLQTAALAGTELDIANYNVGQTNGTNVLVKYEADSITIPSGNPNSGTKNNSGRSSDLTAGKNRISLTLEDTGNASGAALAELMVEYFKKHGGLAENEAFTAFKTALATARPDLASVVGSFSGFSDVTTWLTGVVEADAGAILAGIESNGLESFLEEYNIYGVQGNLLADFNNTLGTKFTQNTADGFLRNTVLAQRNYYFAVNEFNKAFSDRALRAKKDVVYTVYWKGDDELYGSMEDLYARYPALFNTANLERYAKPINTGARATVLYDMGEFKDGKPVVYHSLSAFYDAHPEVVLLDPSDIESEYRRDQIEFALGGSSLGLRYSDFGYWMGAYLKADNIDTPPEDYVALNQDDLQSIFGGIAEYHIASTPPSTNLVFTGNAIAKGTHLLTTANGDEFRSMDLSGKASFTLNTAGNANLKVDFDNYYSLNFAQNGSGWTTTVSGENKGKYYTFRDGTGVMRADLAGSGTGDLDYRLYGEDGVPGEVVGGFIYYEGTSTGDGGLREIIGAFGGMTAAQNRANAAANAAGRAGAFDPRLPR